jgi:SulP family sulfate permease
MAAERLVAPAIVRAPLGPTLAAAGSLLAIAIPEQIATAHLIGMPVRTGLIAFVAGSVIFALFGSTRELSSGADSTIAPIIAQGVIGAGLVGAAAVVGVGFASLVVGVAVVAAAVARASWIADLLSLPLVDGVFLGIAVSIAASQLPDAVGMTPARSGALGQLVGFASHLGQARAAPGLIALGVVGMIWLGERRWPRAPMPLVALVAATGLVAALHVAGRAGVAVLGRTTGPLARLGVPVPPPHALGVLVPAGLTAAFVVLVQTAATQRYLEAMTGARSDLGRDLAGVGTGSLVAAAVGSFAVDASPPRSVIVARAGGHTQLVGLIAAGALALVAASGMGLLADAPVAAFAGTLLVVAARLVRRADWRSLWATSRVETVLAGIAAVAVVALGVELGVVVSIALALAFRLRALARPEVVELVRERDSDHWVDPETTSEGERVPGVVVVAVRAPLWFADAETVRQRILAVAAGSRGLRRLVIDADGIPDADVTGARAMHDLEDALAARGIELAWARLLPRVARTLRAQRVDSVGRCAVDVEAAVEGDEGEGAGAPSD